MRYEFWQHKRSGEVWAMMLDDDGEIIGSCGPLHYSEIGAAKHGDYDYTDENNEWFAEYDDDFMLATPSRLQGAEA